MSSLDELGIKAVVLAFMSKGEIQISTQDANASSFVTKVNNNLYKIITVNQGKKRTYRFVFTFKIR